MTSKELEKHHKYIREKAVLHQHSIVSDLNCDPDSVGRRAGQPDA